MLPCIVAGVLLAHFGSTNLWVAAVIMAVAVALIAFRRKALALLAVSVAIGWVAAVIALPRKFQVAPQSIRFAGVVTDVDDARTTLKLTIDVDAQIVDGRPVDTDNFRAVVYVPEFQDVPELGSEVSFDGFYALPQRDIDFPDDDDNVFRSFVAGISLYCTVPPDSLSVNGLDYSLMSRLRRYRQRLVDDIVCSDLSQSASAFVSAVITGENRLVDSAQRDEFAMAGVAHVLALSGAHVAVIVAIVAWLLFPLSLVDWHRMRWICAIVALWLFAMFTGMSASVVRASIMATAVMGAVILDRRRSALNALCFAAIMILIFSPLSLYKVGFQMSFMATLGIVLFSLRFTAEQHRRTWLQKIGVFIGVTLAATVATMPLSLLYFHRIPIYFIPANILVVVLLPVVVVAGVTMIGLMALGVDMPILADVINVVCDVQQSAVGLFAHLTGSTVENVYVGPWLAVALYVAVAIGFGAWIWRRRQLWMLSAGLLATIIGGALLLAPKPDAEEFTILRSKSSTEMFWRNGSHAEIYTTLNRWLTPSDSITFAERCANHLGATDARLEAVRRIVPAEGCCFARMDVCGKHVAVAFDMPADTAAERIDYCVVVQQFKGDVVALAALSRCDTLLLSSDINKRRYRRFVRELSEANVAFRGLREGGFRLTK